MSKQNIHETAADDGVFLLLQRLQAERFFGEVQFMFHDGRVTLIREIRTIKPSELKRNE